MLKQVQFSPADTSLGDIVNSPGLMAICTTSSPTRRELIFSFLWTTSRTYRIPVLAYHLYVVKVCNRNPARINWRVLPDNEVSHFSILLWAVVLDFFHFMSLWFLNRYDLYFTGYQFQLVCWDRHYVTNFQNFNSIYWSKFLRIAVRDQCYHWCTKINWINFYSHSLVSSNSGTG